ALLLRKKPIGLALDLVGTGPRLQSAREQIVQRLLDFFLRFARLGQFAARLGLIGRLLGVAAMALGLLARLAGLLPQLLGAFALTLGLLTLTSFVGGVGTLLGLFLELGGLAFSLAGRVLRGARFLLRVLGLRFQPSLALRAGLLVHQLGQLPRVRQTRLD